jgi:hypothetical protein
MCKFNRKPEWDSFGHVDLERRMVLNWIVNLYSGFCSLGIRTGIELLYTWLQSFGFHSRLGIS